jgi:hypothetical protein
LTLAFLVWDALGAHHIAIQIGFALLMIVIVELGVLVFLQTGITRAYRLRQDIEALEALPIAEAKLLAIPLLSESRVPGSASGRIPEGCAASQKEFFEQFEGATLGDGTRLTLTGIRVSQWLPDHIVIGEGGGSEIVTAIGDDRVWEIEGPVANEDLEELSSPSIWHFYLANCGHDWKAMIGRGSVWDR